MKDDNPTTFDRTDYENDVTAYYNVEGGLNDLIAEFKDLQEAAKGAKVTGRGGGAKFTDGHFVGDTATLSRTFTVDMDARAYKIENMRDALTAFGGDELDVDVEIDVSGSTTRGVPLWKDGRMVAAKSVPDLDEEEYDYTGKVTVTVDVTPLMNGTPDDQ